MLFQLLFVSDVPLSVAAVLSLVVLQFDASCRLWLVLSLTAIRSGIAPGFPMLLSVVDGILLVAVAPRHTHKLTIG